MNIKVFLFIFLLIPFVSAVTYQPNRDINITHSVRLDGVPTNTASCNLTVIGNGTTYVNYAPMTSLTSSKVYTYTIPRTTNLPKQDYTYDITCCENGLCTTEENSFTINTSGVNLTTQSAMFYILSTLFSVGLFIFLIWAFKTTDGEDPKNEFGELVGINYKKYIKYTYLFLCYVVFTWVAFNFWIISYSFLDLDLFSKAIYYFWVIPVNNFAIIMFIILFASLWKLISDVYKSKEINSL